MTAAPVTLETLATVERYYHQIALVRAHWGSVRRRWIDTPDPLRAARLGPDLPPDFWFGGGMPGLASVGKFADGCFEFTEDGRPAVIIPCYDTIPGMLDANAERHAEHLVDLVAVDLDQPDRFWRRRGEALVLGSAYLDIAGQEGAPIPVFRNPMSWLKAGGAGVCILDWDWARDLLLGFELIVEGLDLGDQLEAALKPDIWVRRAAA
ncbi:MAG: hypothetical protein V3S45_01360 [Kiloniellales bacterium]